MVNRISASYMVNTRIPSEKLIKHVAQDMLNRDDFAEVLVIAPTRVYSPFQTPRDVVQSSSAIISTMHGLSMKLSVLKGQCLSSGLQKRLTFLSILSKVLVIAPTRVYLPFQKPRDVVQSPRVKINVIYATSRGSKMEV